MAPLPTKPQDCTAKDLGEVMSMIQGMGEQFDEYRYEYVAEESELVAA